MGNTITIAGCINRIGVTTQAIQLVRTLQENQIKTAYIEMNKTNYLKAVTSLYSKVKESPEKITYSGIDMYKRNGASQIKENKYNILVKDYGAASELYFEDDSYADGDLKLLICGSKPNELMRLKDCLKNPNFQDAFFIFSFVPEEEKTSILSLLGDKCSKAFFSGYIPDPYHLEKSSVELFHRILNQVM